MEKRTPTILVVEDGDMSSVLTELFESLAVVRQEYRSVAAAVEIINGGEVEAVLTGWKIRRAEPLDFNDELAAPRIVAAANDARIPVVVVSSHPDSRGFQKAQVVDKTTMELRELKNLVIGMLSPTSRA